MISDKNGATLLIAINKSVSLISNGLHIYIFIKIKGTNEFI